MGRDFVRDEQDYDADERCHHDHGVRQGIVTRLLLHKSRSIAFVFYLERYRPPSAWRQIRRARVRIRAEAAEDAAPNQGN